MIDVTFRPLAIWPYESTPESARRGYSTFRSGWADTLALLGYELNRLEARNVVLGCGLREQDIRMDGWPRSGARVPLHPGIELSFDTVHGRLVYGTDVCRAWQDNVRSVALGLEALRAVDRYGITRRGEQYAGFKALPAGGPSRERGAELIRKHGSVRAALKATHPDHGGDVAAFADVQAAR